MKTKLLALALLAGGSLFAETRFTISIGSGGYNRGYFRPAPYAIVQPPCPGQGYSWVDGYYGGRNAWVPGYWARPQYNSYQDRLRYEAIAPIEVGLCESSTNRNCFFPHGPRGGDVFGNSIRIT